MESSIQKALEPNLSHNCACDAFYHSKLFQCNALDRVAKFVKEAEAAVGENGRKESWIWNRREKMIRGESEIE